MEKILFEQPLSELCRLNLRLEYLFNKIDENSQLDSIWQTRTCLEALAHIIQLLDRPDIKSKFSQEIQIQINSLEKLSNQPNINTQKLATTLSDLTQLFQLFTQVNSKIGQELRNNEFLNNLRRHLLCPGGEATFELPAYHYWLSESPTRQRAQLQEWLKPLNQLQKAVTLLLMLIRNKGTTKTVTANGGFHQEMLEPNSAIKLLKIEVDIGKHVYPIVSSGKHRLNIRWYESEHTQSEEQVHADIPFTLTCCS
jgi:cell division protein ZapD